MKNKVDIYQKVTERVIAGLEKKGLSWFKAWSSGDDAFPINNTTGKVYNGVNVFWLSAIAQDEGYEFNEWLTFKQAVAKGGMVRKGQKSSEVIFWNIAYKHKDDGRYFANKKKLEEAKVKESECLKIFSLRTFPVFNIGQCDDIEPRRKKVEEVKGTTFKPSDRADKIIKGYKKMPSLKHGGGRAYYSAKKHHIQMPKRDDFTASGDYYHTLFHEMTHSTGHDTCLNRKGVAFGNEGFGSETYSKEELVAEIGSEFLSGLTGVEASKGEENSQAYINGWIKNLKDHPKLIVNASQQAMKSVNFILGD